MENLSTAKQYKIVLIDDEEKLLFGLKAIMRREGYAVFSAQNGNDGAELIREVNPDLIICDVMMPPPNGFQLKRMLADNERYAGIPFIFLTARTSEGDKVTGLAIGADDYITKPFGVDELVGRVKAVLRRTEIQQQKAAKHYEEKFEQFRSAVTSTLSNDLRTPLDLILSGLDLALREKFSGNTENLDLYLQTSLENAHRLSRLIDDLVILGDIDHKQLNKFRRPIDFGFHFMDPIRRIHEFYAEKKLELDVLIEPDLVVYAPEVEFSMAVSHLVDNAAKFSPPAGKISIRLVSNGWGGCVFSISDEGPGIPSQLREKVFERYYQVEQGSDRANGGLGIGLTIARAIAESVGGQVVVIDSVFGCKVYMSLPPLSRQMKSPISSQKDLEGSVADQ